MVFMKNTDQKKYDCIIIGAGIGGLTTACLLAKSGLRVLIIEKNRYAGGYCSYFKRGEFSFESAIHAINGCNQNGRTYNILNECGIWKNLNFIEPAELYKLVFPGVELRFPQKDIKKYMEILIDMFPAESDAIKDLFKEMENIFKEIINSDSPVSENNSASIVWKYRDTTLKDFLDSFLKNKILISILSQYWSYLGVPPSQLSAINYSFIFWDYVCNGASYPEGGSEEVANQLVKKIKEFGGEVIYEAEVVRLISEDGVTIGKVRTKDGAEFHASHFISNINAKRLFLDMLEGITISEMTLNRAKNTDGSVSAVVLYLGLKKDVREMGITDYEIFLNPNNDIESQYIASQCGELQNSQQIITIYSNLNKACSPKGKSLLTVFTLSSYDFWKNLARPDYINKKDEISKMLIASCEKVIPGLSKFIEISEIATPITLESYSGNLKGELYGWVQDISQTGFKRQRPNTNIKNLFLTGAWTRPGGGFSSVVYSGQIAASYITKVFEKKVVSA